MPFLNTACFADEFPPFFRLFDDAASQPSRCFHFQPKFDLHEDDAAYYLEGELPGLSDKKSLNIEFNDGQTLIIHGKVEKLRHTNNFTDVSAPASEEPKGKEVEGSEAAKGSGSVVAEKKEEQPRVWISERTVGSFKRVFRFSKPVETEGVRASLEHGVLSMTVPQRVPEKRRIEIL